MYKQITENLDCSIRVLYTHYVTALLECIDLLSGPTLGYSTANNKNGSTNLYNMFDSFVCCLLLPSQSW